MYVGAADFARGKEVCGLRLDKIRTTTDCDGKYRGERYFRCTPGHGLYIPVEDAEFIGVATGEDFSPAPASGAPPNRNKIVRTPSGDDKNLPTVRPPGLGLGSGWGFGSGSACPPRSRHTPTTVPRRLPHPT